MSTQRPISPWLREVEAVLRLAKDLHARAQSNGNIATESGEAKMWWVVRSAAAEAMKELSIARTRTAALGADVPPLALKGLFEEAPEPPLSDIDGMGVAPRLTWDQAQKMKPLFIPLKREHYEAFVDGSKARNIFGHMEEFRRVGGCWNPSTCPPGRPVVLSLGYGKRRRLQGIVVGFRVSSEPTESEAWKAIYGEGGEAACIAIGHLWPVVAPSIKGAEL